MNLFVADIMLLAEEYSGCPMY